VMTTLDLSNPQHIVQYLSATPWAAKSVTQLSGGFTNFIFRIELAEPYQGQERVVLKHGKPYIATAEQVSFSIERQKSEVAAMKKMREILSPDSLARVPVVYHHDETNHAIIMEDAGQDAVTLRELLNRPNPPSPATGAIAGRVLGEFISKLHAWGKTDQGQTYLDSFEGHQESRDIYARAVYGRLVTTVTGKPKPIPLIHDPPLEFTPEELDKISKFAEERGKEMRVSRETMVMGDFWFANALVVLDRGSDGSEKLQKIFMVDWEVAGPGVAAFDVGQFQSGIFTAQHFNPVCNPTTKALDAAFLEGYLSIEPGLDRKKTTQHLASHLVIWVPRVGWEPAEKTKALVDHWIHSITSSL